MTTLTSANTCPGLYERWSQTTEENPLSVTETYDYDSPFTNASAKTGASQIAHGTSSASPLQISSCAACCSSRHWQMSRSGTLITSQFSSTSSCSSFCLTSFSFPRGSLLFLATSRPSCNAGHISVTLQPISRLFSRQLD